jgi:hypothetical protein
VVDRENVAVRLVGVLWFGLSIAEATDIIWTTIAPEVYLLLVHERGWERARFERWLAESWAWLLPADSERPLRIRPESTGPRHPYARTQIP